MHARVYEARRSGTCGTCHEDQTVPAAEQLADLLPLAPAEAEVVERRDLVRRHEPDRDELALGSRRGQQMTRTQLTLWRLDREPVVRVVARSVERLALQARREARVSRRRKIDHVLE